MEMILGPFKPLVGGYLPRERPETWLFDLAPQGSDQREWAACADPIVGGH